MPSLFGFSYQKMLAAMTTRAEIFPRLPLSAEDLASANAFYPSRFTMCLPKVRWRLDGKLPPVCFDPVDPNPFRPDTVA